MYAVFVLSIRWSFLRSVQTNVHTLQCDEYEYIIIMIVRFWMKAKIKKLLLMR